MGIVLEPGIYMSRNQPVRLSSDTHREGDRVDNLSRQMSKVCEPKRRPRQLHHANTLDAGAQPHAPIGQGFQLLSSSRLHPLFGRSVWEGSV